MLYKGDTLLFFLSFFTLGLSYSNNDHASYTEADLYVDNESNKKKQYDHSLAFVTIFSRKRQLLQQYTVNLDNLDADDLEISPSRH